MSVLFSLLFFINAISSNLDENCKGQLKDGKKEGQWICYYENGKKLQEGSYKGDQKEGRWKYYHQNGKLALEGEFKAGSEVGTWKMYSEEGKLIEEIKY